MMKTSFNIFDICHSMTYTLLMAWTIEFTNKAKKQISKLSKQAFDALRLLVEDLEYNGRNPGKEWPHYGKLKGTKKGEDLRHCHLVRGKPTYVSCWAVIDKKLKIIEVYYVGTHEKAPY